MKKLLLLTVVALATLAAAAPAASANVEVRDSNGQLCSSGCGFNFEGYFEIQGGLRCVIYGNAAVGTNGYGELYNIDFTHGSGTGGFCETMRSCYGGMSWPFQILAPGDEGYTGLEEFEALAYGCYHETGNALLDSHGFDFTIAIDESDWDWSVPWQAHTAGTQMSISEIEQSDTVQVTDVE